MCPQLPRTSKGGWVGKLGRLCRQGGPTQGRTVGTSPSHSLYQRRLHQEPTPPPGNAPKLRVQGVPCLAWCQPPPSPTLPPCPPTRTQPRTRGFDFVFFAIESRAWPALSATLVHPHPLRPLRGLVSYLRLVPRSPSAAFVSYLRRATPTRDCETSPKLGRVSHGRTKTRIQAAPILPRFKSRGWAAPLQAPAGRKKREKRYDSTRMAPPLTMSRGFG